MSEVEQKGGTFEGNSHDNGGIKFTVPETGQQIEVEGKEPLIPAEAIEPEKEITLKGTNKEIIDDINQSVGAKTTDEKATKVHAGDFIVCKRSAADDKEREIVENEMRKIGLRIEKNKLQKQIGEAKEQKVKEGLNRQIEEKDKYEKKNCESSKENKRD